VEQFIGLIREMAQETQFLVITHNRRTMEGADKLVGVTQEEPGCSMLVTVNVPKPRASGQDPHDVRAAAS
jgi:chromosome segregation protein